MHVVLMDIQMPRMTGIEATQAIMARLPETKIVILTTFDDQEFLYKGIRAGAIGYLLKDAVVEEMLEAIRSSFRGEAGIKRGWRRMLFPVSLPQAAFRMPTERAIRSYCWSL